MNNMELSVEKSWIENQDYLQGLVKELSNKKVDEMDSNLVYEVAYASTYISIVLSKESTIVSGWLYDCKAVFDMVLSSVPYDKIQEVSANDYRDLLKCKYDDVEDASYVRSYTEPNSSAIQLFLKKNTSRIIITMVIWFFSLFLVGNNDINSEIAERFPYLPLFLNVVKMVLMFGVIFNILSLCISLLYIMIPMFRDIRFQEIVNISNMVSVSAKQAVEESVKNIVVTKKIKDYDRENRNKVWLKSMLESEKASKGVFFVDRSVLEGINERLKSATGKDYYFALAQVEFLHDKFIKYTKSI